MTTHLMSGFLNDSKICGFFFLGLHMVLSYYALADRDNMRKSFLRLLDVQIDSDDFDKLVPEVCKLARDV